MSEHSLDWLSRELERRAVDLTLHVPRRQSDGFVAVLVAGDDPVLRTIGEGVTLDRAVQAALDAWGGGTVADDDTVPPFMVKTGGN